MANPPIKVSSSGFSIMTTIFAITAFIMMWIGSLRCNFLKFISTSSTEQPVTIELGTWYYQSWAAVASTSGTYVFENCVGYPDMTDIDSSWKAARAFSIMAFILGVIMLVIASIAACSTGPGDLGSTHRFEAPAYFLTALCQGLVLLLLSSNACNSNVLADLNTPLSNQAEFGETCEMSTGAKFIISATAFWVGAAVMSVMARKTEMKELEEAEAVIGGGSNDLTEPLTA